MGEVNMNDYIWYIIIGVIILFIIIGFVADKTGLAKKTFSKSIIEKKGNNKEKSETPIVDNYSSVEPPITEPVVGNDIESPSDLSGSMPLMNDTINSDNSELKISEPIVEDNTIEEQTTPSGNNDIASTSNEWAIDETNSNNDAADNIYLAEEKDFETNSNSVDLEKAYLESENAEVPEASADVNNNHPEEVVVDAPVTEQMPVENTASDDEGDNMNLPELDNLNFKEDEDVWKF